MSRRTERNVGVVGLGIIGQRVAECLRRRGFHTFVWNRTPHPFPNFVGSPVEIAELCDFIQIFVSDDDALLQIVQGIKRSLNANHIVMAHCTVAPYTMRAAAEIVHRRGAQLLDATFTGSKAAAEKGELVYYIGGDDAAYRRARPVLEASSKEIIEIGEIGQATTIKVATNMVTAAIVQAAAEALALVHNAGLPLERFAEAMRSNGSNSATLAMKLPKMLEGNFEPHFSVKHMLKDVQIASRLARSYGLTLGATEVARDALAKDAAEGHADEDYSSVMRVFFPEGPPGRLVNAAAGEEQTTLNGLEELPPADPAHALMAEMMHAQAVEIAPPAAEIAHAPVEDVEKHEQSLAEVAPVAREEVSFPETQRESEPRPIETKSEQQNGNAAPVLEIETTREIAVATSTPEEEEEPRGFFSRLFYKAGDY